MMNLPGVFMADPETCARIDAANQTPSKQVDGHAPLVAGKDLNAYAAAGIIADHESTIPEEALDKLSRGMYVMLREGTCSHDLANLSPMLLENPARARRCCFATDDRAPSDALATGMIDNACRVAIEAGIDPVVAISMASLSTAEAFGLDHGCRDPHELRGAIAPGKRADLLVLNDLTFATAPHRVYAAGALVAQDGTFVGEIAPEMAEVAALADELRASVKLPKLSLDVFDYAFKPGEAVIDVVPGKAITGMARPESAEGLRRIMLIERHGRGVSLQAEGADAMAPLAWAWSASISVAAGAWLHHHRRCHRLDDRSRLAQRMRGGRQCRRYDGCRRGRGPGRSRTGAQRRGRGAHPAGARRPDERRHGRGCRRAARRLYGQGARHGHRAAARPHHGHHLPAPAGYPDAPHPPRGHVRRHNLHLRRLVIGDVLKRLVACDTL